MVSYGYGTVGAGLGWQQALHGRRLGLPKLPIVPDVSSNDSSVVRQTAIGLCSEGARQPSDCGMVWG
jgi:hypothetical protein